MDLAQKESTDGIGGTKMTGAGAGLQKVHIDHFQTPIQIFSFCIDNITNIMFFTFLRKKQ